MKRVRNIWRGLLLTVLAVSALCMGAGAIDVDDCEALYQEITVEAGQLMPETGETVESDIYGYIVGYELKKGHVLSISDTDYVFSVRQLVDGDYSTLLKSATNASFTAVEDMTVGCLVRKPDRSAVTEDELAGVTLVDTLYGMEGVEGYAHRFTVGAETIDGGTQTTRACLFLPESYSEDGDPTPLIVMTNGYSAYLTESVWNGNTAENRGVIQNYLDAGYGVYVVDNTAAWTAQTPDLGCPQLVDSYWEAYDYIQEHFNVTEKLIIHARSFGTFAAVRMMREQPEEITCAVMTGPRVSMKLAWNAVDKAFVAGRFGFADASGATYEENILAGHDPYTDVDGAEYVLPPTFWMMAEGDSTAQPLEMIEKLKAHGNEAETATYSGVSHTGVCTLNAEEMAADALAYIAAQREKGLAGKKLSILGASISTFAGVSNGAAAETTNSTIAGNAKYYPSTTVTDVALEDTWWMQAVNDLGLELLVNNSWSGSSLLHERSGTVGAYVERCVQLHDDTGDNAGTDPDLIAIQLGTNDFQYYKDTLGTADIDYDALITANGEGTYTYAEPQTSLEAAAIVLHKIGVRYPKAEVYYLNLSQRVDGTDVLLAQFNEELAKVTAHFGAYLVDIYGSAITQADFDTYIGDGRVHPNKLGMDVYAEAFKTAVLENTAYSAQAHTVRLNLTGVSADYGTDKLVLDGEGFAVTLSAAAGDTMEVAVTMGGKDITASCYAEGVVTINAVTADVVITAAAAHIPQNYIWTYDGSGLAGENALTMLAGTVTDGQFDKVCYSLETPVVLSHERPWVVEWKSEGTWRNSASSTGGRLFSTTDVNAQYNARYIFKSANGYLVAMGEKTTTGSHNYGIALSDYGIDGSAEHTYRLENRVSDDGSNMVWLYVDGTEIGPMNHYYIGTTDQKTASDWLSSKDFVLPYIGTDTHGLTNCSVEYIKVYEDGHEHVYETAVTAPTCTEKGYTTYTCACGESYADDYVDAIGHSWEDGVCTTCGESKRPYQRLTYFTVEVQTEDGQSYSDNAVLYLPKTYSPDGEPVKLIIYCKQGNSQITDSSNPIETVGFYNYLISLGYAVLGVDGVPDAWREKLGLDDTRVVGNPLAVQGTEKAYDYVVEHYNIDADGCFISGKSQGGHYAQNVIDLTDIPILAAAEQSPVCSMQYHQWDLNASKTIGGVSFTKAARLNVARIYGFPEVTSNTELLALEYDADLVAEYDPWVRNSENVYTGFSQKSNLWYLPGGTSAEDIAMTKISRCPVKIWCAEDDTAISADVMKVFVQAIQNGGGTAEISVASSGGHGFFTKQSAVGTFIENGKQYSTLPIAVEIAEWFARYGGYECKHEYAVAVTVPTCTEQGYTTYTCSVCGEKYVADYVDALGHSYENGVCTACGDAIMIVSLRYDDHMDVSGKTVEIIDAGTPTSYQVGYGIAEKSVLDTAVVTLEGETLVATGVGSAKVRIDGQIYQVEVSAAPISLLLLAGQSNMQGSEGDANQSIICPEGQVYATYGDRYTMTVDNATNFAASALTGAGSAVNVNGTTENLSGYPIYSLNAAGAGKAGPDSGFAYEWVQQTGEKVWVVNAAHGGSAISTWQKSGANYKEAVALFSACQETLRQEIAAGHYTLSHMGYFWCQGCADEPQTAEWYVNKYLAMHESLKAALVADMDSDPATADVTLEFAGIIPIRSGHQNSVSYRGGVYTDTTSVPYYESFLDLRMNGPRVAQYWMGNNPELEDIWIVCNIGEDWVWMPNGTNAVTEYFQSHYPNGTVDYTTQVAQKGSWYTPTTPAAVHDSIHYNQIGYNEVGRESVRNALILLGEIEAPEAETTVEFLTWDGVTSAQEVTAWTEGTSDSLVVPVVSPIWKAKEVTYGVTDDLTYSYYDLLADSARTEGTLTASTGERVSVVKQEPSAYFADHLSQQPEPLCCGVNLWAELEHDDQFYSGGTHWAVHSSGTVYSMTIPVEPGDRIFATSFGKAGENGNASSNGIRCTFFGEYEVVKTLAPADTYAEFTANGGYLIVPEGAVAVNVPMWTNDESNELYILNLPHDQTEEICSICGEDSHSHVWSDWETVSLPTADALGVEERKCECGETETREIVGIWQKYALADHMQAMPEAYCAGTNLWTVLEHDDQYFLSGSSWGKHSSGTVYSVTIPVEPGDRIFATSFGKAGENGTTQNGIRVTFFDSYGVLKTMAPSETYPAFTTNGGCLIAPEGAVAVNVPMWNNGDENELYILNAEHDYSGVSCTICGAEHPEKADYSGKVISILGDSISTFAGYIPTADGFNLEHLARYPQDNLLTDVNETWWMQVISELDAKLGINDSWRGATLSGGAPVTSGTTGENAAMSNLTRIQNLGSNGTPDVILLYGGTNDLAHVSKVGTFVPDTAPSAADLTTKKWDNLADGFVHTLLRLQHYYPDAEIVAMLPTYTISYYSNEKLAQANAVMAAICEHYGVTYVDLRDCGITTADLPDGIHPDATGMDYITDAVLESLLTECDVAAGENEVYSVTHNLTDVKASLGYYKGVSANKAFTETLTADSDMTVTVTMGGTDITNSCYKKGVVSISVVTGNVNITATAEFSLGERLQQLPENICSGSNLWPLLDHDREYYTINGWGVHSSGQVYSVTVPVAPGDQLWATSFRAAGANGGSINGIRLTWFGENGALKSLSADETYAEFAANGFLTVPEGANAANIPMWKVSDSNEVYILNLAHNYNPIVTPPTCTEQGYTTHTCTICGDSYVDSYVDALGHSYSGTAACTVCGDEHPHAANYEDKVISILGASICTFDGYIPVADGFNLQHYARYPQDNLLTDVNDTWWMQVINTLDAKLGINDSWRSTEVYNACTDEVNSSYDGTKACLSSLTRIQNLGSNGTPDVILFFGATNDITQRRPLGVFDPSTAPTEVDLTSETWTTVVDAYTALIMRVRHFYPDAQFVVCLPYSTANNSDEITEQYTSVFAQICAHYGVTCVDLNDCGISVADLPDGTHPNAEGMDYITAAVLGTLLAQGNMKAGENVVHSVVHNLTDAESSKSYYKGISHGTSFVTAITGENLTVTVTMGGEDITDACYADGVVSISAVTGDLVISAKAAFSLGDHLQALPEHICAGTNLWTALEPENLYYMASGWGNNANDNYSITFPVTAGDHIWATSFGKRGENTFSANGTRVTWFDESGVLASVDRDTVYVEFSTNGYLTAPEGAVAVNVPMNDDVDTNEVYILNREHSYGSVVTAPTCTEQGYTTYTCAICSDSYVADYTDALGHDWGEGVKDGRENVYTCLHCGETRREARPGSSVSGSVKSYKPAVETKIVLNEDGEAVYESTVSGTEAGFTVEDVASGTYDAVISKAGYLTYTIQNVTVEDEVDLGEIELVAGDFDGDDRINLSDLAVFRADFGKQDSGLSNATCDIDGDGRVNLTDLAVFRQNFGKTAERNCTVTV